MPNGYFMSWARASILGKESRAAKWRQRLWGPLMLMWEWQAGTRCTGVSQDPGRAIQEAEKHLAVGDSARVERVVAVLSFRTMSSFYSPTGHGWTATRQARGPISWLPLLLSRTDPPCPIQAPPPVARTRIVMRIWPGWSGGKTLHGSGRRLTPSLS